MMFYRPERGSNTRYSISLGRVMQFVYHEVLEDFLVLETCKIRNTRMWRKVVNRIRHSLQIPNQRENFKHVRIT